jgi:hypothetical protein
MGGSISPSGDVSVPDGGDQSFTVTPSAGYHILDVLVDGSSVGAVGFYDFTAVSTDHTIEAQFAADALVGLLVDGGFEYSYSSEYLRANGPTQDWYESRNDVPTLLTLDESDVGGDVTRKAALRNAGIVENAYLTQEFSSPQSGVFTLTYDIYIDRIDNSANYDRTGLMQIGDDSVSTSNPPAGTHNERFAFLVFYDPTPGDSGSDLEIRARTSSLQAYATTSQWTQVASGLSYDRWYTVKLVIDVGAGLYDVYVDGVLKGESISKYSGYASNTVTHLSFSAVSDGRGNYYLDNVEAEEPSVDYWSILASAGQGGSISPSGNVVVADGANQGFTVTPNSGYHIYRVLVDGVSMGAVSSYTFTNVVASHTIAAQFAADTVTWTITASAGTGGSISPSGSVVVADGGSQSFTITPGTGYQTSNVLVDGSSIGAVTSYTFTNVKTSHTIASQFEADEYTLTINVIGLGFVDINPDEASYSYGDVVAISATPVSGWAFAGWSGDLSGSSNPAMLSITEDSTVTAIFMEESAQERTEFIYFSSSSLTLQQHLQGAARAYTTRVNHDRSPLSGFPEDAGPLMRAVNPDCLVLKYMNVAHIYDYDPEFQRYRANGWLVKDEVSHISHSSEIVLDLHIPECRHDVALRAKDYVENYGYDGIFGDYLGKPFAYNKNHYATQLYHQDGTLYTDAQMVADMAALIAEMRALDCGFLLGNAIPQATGSYGYYNSKYYDSCVMLTSLLDMFMIEGSFGWDATEGATRTVYDWEKMIQLYQESTVPQAFYSKSLGSNDKALFVYCSYMMANPGHDQPLHYAGFSTQMGSYWTNLINDVPGNPLGPMQTYGGTEVRYRAYTNGIYYVNPSPTQTYIVEGVSMGPKSGMIIRP